MKTVILHFQIGIALFFLAGLGGCVSQYQREYLGNSIMMFDQDPEEDSLKGHINSRREGSSGGDSGAGGGCGC